MIEQQLIELKLKDYTQHPLLYAGRADNKVKRPAYRKLLAVIPAILVILFSWPWVEELLTDLDGFVQNGVKTPAAEQPAPASRARDFKELLDIALGHDRNGERQLAHQAFQQLLHQLQPGDAPTEQSALLLVRAASFYNGQHELAPMEVEDLYLQALAAVTMVHGESYYDLETVHQGLEQYYLSQASFDKAVRQTRLLLAFYRRYHRDEGTRTAFLAPTLVRLGHNLMQAGQNVEAREAYQAAISMWQAQGKSTAAIESFVESTYTTDNESRAERNLKAAVEALSAQDVTVEQISEDNGRITITGFASDNMRVAAYLRQLKSDVGEPRLDYVRSGRRQGSDISEFSIAIDK